MAEATLSRSDVYSARPTVQVSGQVVTAVAELLRSLEVVETEVGLSSVELVLDNRKSASDGSAGWAFEDERTFRFGVDLVVGLGDERAPTEVFRGKVTAMEGRFEDGDAALVVYAEDGLQRARMARRTKVYDNLTVDDLAEQIARAAGLRASVSGFSGSLGLQVQFNESDLAFLRRVLWTVDGDAQAVGDELRVRPRKEAQRGVVELAWLQQLRRARVTADLAHQVTKTTVQGWNARDGARTSGEATGGDLGPGRGRRGSALLAEALATREEHLAQLPAVTNAEAQALAAAAFQRRARRFVCVEATCEGNPLVRVGTHVRLTGIGDRFSNTYYVTRARHRYDVSRGYETEFEAEGAFLGTT